MSTVEFDLEIAQGVVLLTVAEIGGFVVEADLVDP